MLLHPDKLITSFNDMSGCGFKFWKSLVPVFRDIGSKDGCCGYRTAYPLWMEIYTCCH